MRAIAGLCIDLDIGVTAEGVETIAEHDMLAQHGCSHFQGYLVSPALAPGELRPFLTGTSSSVREVA